MKKLLSFALILFLSAGFFISCKKDKGNPPVLPPVESMTIDFTNFISSAKSADLGFSQKGINNSNWLFASTVAVFWKSIINTTLAIPVTSFKLAVDQDPVFLSDNTWEWSYNVSSAGVSYKARLTGQIQSTDVAWKMYITKEGTNGFAEFLWFQGTSKIDGTGGSWTLNESSSSQVPLIQIDWTKTDASIGSIKYTYMKNDSYKTNYITYGLTSNTLNANYAIQYYNGTKVLSILVEWSTTTKNGRVQCLDYFGDSNWHQWDANYVNI
jgi:hypothetical protein